MNYKKDFLNSLSTAKIGLIVFFILITIIYQLKFHTITPANTFFGHKKTTGIVISDSIITGFLGVLSVIIVILCRSGYTNLLTHWKAYLVVFIILFLFNLAQESSGLNRYLAESETAQGLGPYAELDDTLTPEGRAKFKATNKEGDFFISAIAYTCALILIFLILYFSYSMIKASYHGYKSGENNIPNLWLFSIELFLVVILNGLAPVISTKLRGENYSRTKASVIVFICILVIIIHLMFQYNGLYKM